MPSGMPELIASQRAFRRLGSPIDSFSKLFKRWALRIEIFVTEFLFVFASDPERGQDHHGGEECQRNAGNKFPSVRPLSSPSLISLRRWSCRAWHPPEGCSFHARRI